MTKNSLLKKFLIYFFALSLVTLVLSQGLFFYITSAQRKNFGHRAPQDIARIIDNIASEVGRSKAATLKLFKGNERFLIPLGIWLLDAKGQVLYPSDGANPAIDSATFEKRSSTPYEFIPTARGEKIGPMQPVAGIVRLSGEPVQYLYFQPDPAQEAHRPPMPFFVPVLSLVLSVFFSGIMTFLFILSYLRDKALLADKVIFALQKGDLKARFPIHKMDEVGQAMVRFNVMAEEIERLVENIKQTEHGRLKILQELAHDLRTPVASLKTMLETLFEKEKVSNKIREELLSLSLKEVAYFEHLVEDLLFLAQVKEPKYSAKTSKIDLKALLKNEVEMFRTKKPGKKITFDSDRQPNLSLLGDPHLLKRLFINALENATSFAKKEIAVQVHRSGNSVVIEIQDDGPGFKNETLASFGERRSTRMLEASNDEAERISVGLGSVIMKTICQAHGGTVVASNHRDTAGNKLGATLTITLPAES